jgi:dihydrofolate synthase/folylpolyglutamate synthase
VKPTKSLPTDLAGWLQYIEALHPKSISMGLDRVLEVKNRLNLNPDFPLIIVGGTNGKGSTCAMLESIYHEAGYNVACYTSPHLLRYNERVRINTAEVSDEAMVAGFNAVETARGDTQLTYFEFGTLAAVWCFMQHRVDVAILEVGLGGRLDAVNVFEPACTVITAVDIDHIDFLGDNRESIGFEKAGIFRKGVAAVCGDYAPPASLIQYAQQVGARLELIGHDFNQCRNGKTWDFSGSSIVKGLPLPALTGDFQLINAASALAVIDVMQIKLSVCREHMAAGLSHVRLAGRFQCVARNPKIILDVTHNPHAAIALAQNLHQQQTEGRTLAVFAMLSDKDVAGVIAAVAPEIDHWYVSTVEHARAAGLSQLLEIFEQTEVFTEIQAFDNLTAALRQACLDAGRNDRIVIFGSFFTVAEVMRVLPALTFNISS